jgi:hypothetical protein
MPRHRHCGGSLRSGTYNLNISHFSASDVFILLELGNILGTLLDHVQCHSLFYAYSSPGLPISFFFSLLYMGSSYVGISNKRLGCPVEILEIGQSRHLSILVVKKPSG